MVALLFRYFLWGTLFVAASSWAMPASINAQLNALGKGEMRWLFMDLYEAEYFAKSNEENLNPPIALKLRYQRNISSAALVEATLKEWQRMDIESDGIDEWVNVLTDMWPNVEKYDEIICYVNEDKITTFYFNNVELGKIYDKEFYSHFLAIWLSEKARNQKLRKQLLGENKA